MSEASMLVDQHSGGSKVAPPPHALALYQHQITMAHGESSQEVKQQQPLSGQLGKQQPYHAQADRDRDSPQIRSRSPSSSDKDGRKTTNATHVCTLSCCEGWLCRQVHVGFTQNHMTFLLPSSSLVWLPLPLQVDVCCCARSKIAFADSENMLMINQSAANAVLPAPVLVFLSFLIARSNLESLFFSALGRKLFLGHSWMRGTD